MRKINKLFRRGAELAVFGLAMGILIAGCGGGGGGTAAVSAGNTAVASYIADGRNGGFNGNWATSSVASATAYTETLSSTSQPGVFAMTNTFKVLSSGSWANSAVVNSSGYNLTPAGWALDTNDMVGNTFIDSGNGANASLLQSNGASYNYAIARTSPRNMRARRLAPLPLREEHEQYAALP